MKLLKKIGVPSLIILLMQLSMYPYILQLFFAFPEERTMAIVFFVIILIYCLFIRKRQKEMPLELIILMIIQSLTWFVYYVMFDDTSYITRIFFIILTFLSLSMLLWKGHTIRYINSYCKFLTIQGVLGIIAFFLLLGGIIRPLISIETANGLGSINFFGITCSNAVYDNFMRVGGFFDEPGAFAFWGMFALIFNKLTIDNKRLEIVLIVSLIFTFSAAYLLLLPIYFLCFHTARIKSFILPLLVLTPLLFILNKTLSSNSDFLYYTVERFSGEQIRSKRFEQSDNAQFLFKKSPVFGVGGRNFESMGGNTISDNPYEILAKDGIVGFIITYLPLLYIICKYWREKEVWFSSSILFLDYMQRPFHINEMHYFMLYMFCLLLVQKYSIERVRHKQTLSI